MRRGSRATGGAHNFTQLNWTRSVYRARVSIWCHKNISGEEAPPLNCGCPKRQRSLTCSLRWWQREGWEWVDKCTCKRTMGCYKARGQGGRKAATNSRGRACSSRFESFPANGPRDNPSPCPLLLAQPGPGPWLPGSSARRQSQRERLAGWTDGITIAPITFPPFFRCWGSQGG